MPQLVPPDVAFLPLLPILLVLAGALISTLLGFWVGRRTLTMINIVTVILSGASMMSLWNGGLTSFAGSLQADNAAILLGLIVLVGTLMSLLVSLDTAWRERVSFPEFDAMMMYAVTGCLLIVFSGDLIVMLIGLEIMSLAGYVLATFQARAAPRNRA